MWEYLVSAVGGISLWESLKYINRKKEEKALERVSLMSISSGMEESVKYLVRMGKQDRTFAEGESESVINNYFNVIRFYSHRRIPKHLIKVWPRFETATKNLEKQIKELNPSFRGFVQ